jgi:GNAT superfamily N-acetyltransferase
VTSGGGPHLVREMHPELAAALGSLWVAVTRAGGAVGFVPDSPESDIRAAAEQVVSDVAAGYEQMIVIGTPPDLLGTVFLRPGRGKVIAHRAELVRLMVHPDRQRGGRGGELLDAAADRAREIGLEQLLLSARGGTTLPDYYRARGWTPVGVWPGALRLGPDDVRDEHWFQLRLSRS